MNIFLLCLLLYVLGHHGLTIHGSIGLIWILGAFLDTGLTVLFMYWKWGKP